MTTVTDNAENQAKAQLENIQAMMARLEHAMQCDSEMGMCDADFQDIFEGLDVLADHPMTEKEFEQYHDEDEARQRIHESPLSVEVRSDWIESGQTFEPAEYQILLMMGGPAVRIIGDLDEHGVPERARLQYQDWGTPWTNYPIDTAQENVLLSYARNFVFAA